MRSLVLKLVLTPALIALASLAGRRRGAALSGRLAALPLVSGPVAFSLALDHGTAFAFGAAAGLLAGTISQAGFSLAYSRLALRHSWPLAGAAGCLFFAGSTILLQWATIPVVPLFVIVIAALAVAIRLAPVSTELSVSNSASRLNVPAQMIVATAFVLLLTAIAPALGSHLTGLLASFPLIAAMLAIASHRRQDPAVAIGVLRGHLGGLFAVATFFLVLSALLQSSGTAPAFSVATAVLLALQALGLRAQQRSSARAQDRAMQRWRRVIRGRYLLLLLLVALTVAFRQPLTTNAKVILLISQEFPQIPIKPLDLVTNAPDHRRLVLSSPKGPIVADLYLPRPLLGAAHAEPGIILAFGVKVPQSAKRDVLRLASALARLGYVTIWPRLRFLDEEHPGVEEPSTFLQAFAYLETFPAVDRRRISYFGVSVGSSIAFVAAADPHIARRVRSLIFFGGYFDIFDYLISLATGRDRAERREIAWRPSHDPVRQVKEILQRQGASSVLRIFQARTRSQARHLLAVANKKEVVALRRFSPSDHLQGFRARIFLLHDKSDDYVPYVESEKLDHALPHSIHRTILLSDLFQHVEPGGGNLQRAAGQYVNLYGFAFEAFDYL